MKIDYEAIIKAYNNLIQNNYLKKYSNDNLIEFDAVFVKNRDEKIDSSVTLSPFNSIIYLNDLINVYGILSGNLQ